MDGFSTSRSLTFNSFNNTDFAILRSDYRQIILRSSLLSGESLKYGFFNYVEGRGKSLYKSISIKSKKKSHSSESFEELQIKMNSYSNWKYNNKILQQ